jgi:tetratricopeptide (TPR) repeat protein
VPDKPKPRSRYCSTGYDPVPPESIVDVMRSRVQPIPWSALIRAVAVTAGLPLMLGLVVARPHPRVLLGNAAWFVGAMYASTIAHELGHAMSGRLLGLRVWRITLGSGPMIAQTKVLDFELRFGVIPIGGLTFLLPGSKSWTRLRYWSAIAAGPAVTAAILSLAFTWAEPYDFGIDVAPLQMLALANAVLLLSVLVPLRFSGALGLQATDGWQLLALTFLPEPKLADLRCTPQVIEIVDVLENGSASHAVELCNSALKSFPGNVALTSLKASAYLSLEDFAQARSVLEGVLARSELDHATRLLLRNNLAWTHLQLADDTLLPDADELSTEVIRELPRTSWANGTRGAVLVRCGRAAEGRRHLKTAFDTNPDPRARAHNASWLAVAEAELQNPKLASDWLAVAERLDANSYSLPRARAAVHAASDDYRYTASG